MGEQHAVAAAQQVLAATLERAAHHRLQRALEQQAARAAEGQPAQRGVGQAERHLERHLRARPEVDLASAAAGAARISASPSATASGCVG
jgi:hypothetical protein